MSTSPCHPRFLEKVHYFYSLFVVFRLLYAVNARQNERRAQSDNTTTSQHKYIKCLQTAIWLKMLYNIKHTYKKYKKKELHMTSSCVYECTKHETSTDVIHKVYWHMKSSNWPYHEHKCHHMAY